MPVPVPVLVPVPDPPKRPLGKRLPPVVPLPVVPVPVVPVLVPVELVEGGGGIHRRLLVGTMPLVIPVVEYHLPGVVEAPLLLAGVAEPVAPLAELLGAPLVLGRPLVAPPVADPTGVEVALGSVAATLPAVLPMGEEESPESTWMLVGFRSIPNCGALPAASSETAAFQLSVGITSPTVPGGRVIPVPPAAEGVPAAEGAAPAPLVLPAVPGDWFTLCVALNE